jgi:hypothetical protein
MFKAISACENFNGDETEGDVVLTPAAHLAKIADDLLERIHHPPTLPVIVKQGEMLQQNGQTCTQW